MADTRGVLIVGEDAVLKGEVRHGRRVEVYGYVEGVVDADHVIVQPGGKLYGDVRAGQAEVRGTVQGDVRVQNLIAIKSTGSVTGDVKYGRMSMEEGGDLSAKVRNVPPSITGDLDLSVPRNGSVRITRADLAAVDPDDAASDLTFEVSNVSGGFLSRASAPQSPVNVFTQADLNEGMISFVHDGSRVPRGRFDCVVRDSDGATSGAAQTVNVSIGN